ncbi:hypothetical protein M407DRAFT_32594 [Tulasnella calospora MUT 4182]|uniref:Uncharacterized protein n=1 Tax=Tulasnella calospora MUT 4182 TaxID=1051891 RepID=A0A0C3K8H2_9AGAM|nr:hypothetical protein M407DRAFT_32594 [Tulasnella calospora MUT 4182]
MSSKIQDIADDSLFDDCSWLSRLLSSGIRPEVSIQFPDVPKTHPALVVANGLHYLEVQMKCRVLDEPTRELTIEVATLLALSLLATSQEEDDNILENQASLPAQADRDWLINALSDSFSALDLDSNLQPLNVQELASKLTDVKTGFTSRGSNALAA